MPKETFDAALFVDAEAAKEAAGVLQAGIEQEARGNPVGTFQVAIDSATLANSQGSGRLQITYQLRVLVGEFKDETLTKYDGLGTEGQAKITVSQLKRLGVDTGKLTMQTLPAVLLSLKDKQVVVAAKQNGEFYNINFQKVITAPINVKPSTGSAPAGQKF